ncbi:aminopeptidase N [Streptomyces sp. V4I23]|nr:aminopeptidase N [Streptomyces sp. V4I23]
MAHQWFGNSVTRRKWKDVWLNEGMATYAEWLWEEE